MRRAVCIGYDEDKEEPQIRGEKQEEEAREDDWRSDHLLILPTFTPSRVQKIEIREMFEDVSPHWIGPYIDYLTEYSEQQGASRSVFVEEFDEGVLFYEVTRNKGTVTIQKSCWNEAGSYESEGGGFNDGPGLFYQNALFALWNQAVADELETCGPEQLGLGHHMERSEKKSGSSRLFSYAVLGAGLATAGVVGYTFLK